MARINIAEIRRREIVDAAVTVIAREGWAAASIDEITREAGVSRGLVSYHFRDKAELLSGVLERCRQTFRDAVAEAAEQSDDPAEALRLATRKAIALTVEDPVVYRIFLYFFANAVAEPELGRQIRDLYGGFRRTVAAAIRAGQQRGIYRRDVDAEAAAARHIGAITGLALQHLLDPGSFPFDDAARQAEEMLIGYIAAPANSTRDYELAAASGA